MGTQAYRRCGSYTGISWVSVRPRPAGQLGRRTCHGDYVEGMTGELRRRGSLQFNLSGRVRGISSGPCETQARVPHDGRARRTGGARRGAAKEGQHPEETLFLPAR